MSIQPHIRYNHEHTDELLNHLRGFLVALDHIADAAISRTADPTTDALMVMIETAQSKLSEVEHARAKEWVGVGGKSPSLTPEEAAQARGEK